MRQNQNQKLRFVLALFCAIILNVPSALAAQDATPISATPVAEATVPGALLPMMDLSADPGEDFYRYASGGWQDRTEIPADRPAFSVSTEVQELTIDQLLGLLNRLATSKELVVGSDEWKAVQLFAQAKDRETRNAQGITPIAAELAEIEALADLDELYAFVREGALTRFVSGFYGVGAGTDLADSSVYTAWYGGPDLGLPNRDYYWVDSESNEAIREAYREMSAALLGYAGYSEDEAADAAQRVYDFEKRLAEPMLRPEDFNDPGNYYHPRPVSDLIAANPDFDWPAYLEILGIPDQETVVVTQLDYLEAIDDILAETDLETLKDYLILQVIRSNAGALSEEIGDTAFAFYGTALSGTEERRPLAERALGAVNGNLGFALGKLYVDEYFPPAAKAEIEAMVARLIAATRLRIEALEWMSPQTKEAALAKLDSMRVKVGYPDEWRTYEGVTIEESLAQTLLSANIAEAKRQLARIGGPVDREEWLMLPQEVNAYYSSTRNEIAFPAAYLQPPNFDYQADPAYNYAGIGATIGHEITHAFDQGGSQFDANGNLADWWTETDKTRFEELTDAVAAQYDTIEVLPGLNVDGGLTIGENIADMGGLQIAYDALQAALAETGDPGLIEGLTQDQRFFIAYAFGWAQEAREEYLRLLMQSDSHAPAQVRAVQPARNMEAFFAAFGIEPGDPVYLSPEERIVIW